MLSSSWQQLGCKLRATPWPPGLGLLWGSVRAMIIVGVRNTKGSKNSTNNTKSGDNSTKSYDRKVRGVQATNCMDWSDVYIDLEELQGA